MRPAVLFLALACAVSGAELPVTKVAGIDYVSVEDAAANLGLRIERVNPATILLKDGARPVARLTDHSREIDLRGLRVFFGDPVAEHGGIFYVSRTDYAVRLVPRLRPALCGMPPRIPHVIAIDPGHGGEDHGTENRALGSMEKTYTLDVSLRLKRLLEGAGYKVVLTRDGDFDVPKAIRSEIANRAGADLFVSVHFNSLYPNSKTTGVEVLLFPPRTQRSSNSMSPGQKDDSEREDSPINRSNVWNCVLAGALHHSLLLALHDGDRGEKFEHLGVLRLLKCPGVLVEPAFLSSDTEGVLLASPAYRDTIAAAVCGGIRDYAAEIASLQPPAAPAATPSGRSQPSRPGTP